MSGYLYCEPQPTENCPYCGTLCHADFVDVGVGMVQCGPFHCVECGASERGAYDEPRELSDIEKKTGWYEPDSEPGSSAIVIDGRVVGYHEMKRVYEEEFTGNPLWHDKDYVDNWWEHIRKIND